jgi:hypothetical protein
MGIKSRFIPYEGLFFPHFYANMSRRSETKQCILCTIYLERGKMGMAGRYGIQTIHLLIRIYGHGIPYNSVLIYP